LSFFRLAELAARSLGHVPVCTLPALARQPPCQPKKVLRHTSFGLLAKPAGIFRIIFYSTQILRHFSRIKANGCDV